MAPTPLRVLAGSVAAAALALSSTATGSSAESFTPTLTVSTVMDGLEHPWDIAFLADGGMLVTERARKTVKLRLPNGTVRTVLDKPSVWASGETGLMAIELAPDRPSTDFITCLGYESPSGARDVRVVRWRLNAARTSASHVRDLVTGIPVTSGRHGGCSLSATSGNTLLIGTGDAAVGTAPQNRYTYGGKVLKVDARTGAPWPTNPFISSSSTVRQRVISYGHRNVQGLARRADGTAFDIEQGSYRDDEVNRLVLGGNYGWNPVPRTSGDPAYNEGANSPMTDFSLAGAQRGPTYRTGSSTLALSAGAFVSGSRWGTFDGRLAVTALKGQRVLFVDTTRANTAAAPTALTSFGRLRAVAFNRNGNLYVGTANGTNDRILRVVPSR